jgi:hypothetical protein
MRRSFQGLGFFLLFVVCLTTSVWGINTLSRRLIGMQDISFATGGTGAAETFTYTTDSGLVLTLDKFDASHLKFRAVAGSVDDLINAAYSLTLKLKEVVLKGPEVDARAHGTVGTQAAIVAALADIGAKQKTLVIYPALTDTTTTWSISADLTIPANITLKVSRGAFLGIATTKTLTINGTFDAGLYQVFSCTDSGKVVFATGSVKEVYPEWWATNTTPGTTDMSAAINAAIATGQKVFLGGLYAVDSCINATNRRGVALIGNGREMYNGTAYGATLIGNTGAGKAILDVCGSVGAQIQGINFYGGTSTVGIITGKTTVDGCNRAIYRDVTIHFDSDITANGGLGTIGLINKSAENQTYEHFESYADNPIILANVATTDWIAAGSTYTLASEYATLYGLFSCQMHTFVGDCSLICLNKDRYPIAVNSAAIIDLGNTYLAGTDAAHNVAAMLLYSGNTLSFKGAAENFNTLFKTPGTFANLDINCNFTPYGTDPIIDLTSGALNLGSLVNARVSVSLPIGTAARCFLYSSDSPHVPYSDNVELYSDIMTTGDLATIQPPAALLAKCRGLKISLVGGTVTPLIDWATDAAVVGFSATSVNKVYYREVNGVVHVICQFTGTSDSTVITFTLPYASLFDTKGSITQIADNGGAIQANSGLVVISGTTASIYKDTAGAAFTAANAKLAWGEFFYFK